MSYGAIMKRVLVYGMTDNPGGIESYLKMLLYKMKDLGIQLDFVTDFPTIAYEKELKETDCRIFFIPAKGKKLFKHWSGIKKILKEHPEYDNVYFNLLDAGGVFTAVVAKMMKRKVIVHSHNNGTDKKMLHRICKPFLKLITDCCVSCSKSAAEYMFGKKIVKESNYLVIPNAIDAENFEFNENIRIEYRQKLDVEKNFVICHVGRITRQKNPYRLIDIFEKVYEKDPSAILIHVGNGELKEEFIEYVNSKKCSSKIKILGVRKDISEIMQASDVFFLPSLYEGLGIVAVEAQAAGLPVVLSTKVAEEIGITNNLTFVDLNDTDDVWADKILNYKNFHRESTKEIIIDKGYDKNTMSVVYDKLARYMA